MMKKRYAIFAAALAMMSVAATSCQKEDNGDEPLVSFKAVIDQGHKTHLDDINNDGTWLGVAWDPTDRVMLTNSDGRASEYTIGSITNNVATFNCTNQPTNQDQMRGTFFRAMYPASYVKLQSDGTMILDIPMVQRYAEHSMMGSPMYAEYTRSNSSSMFNQNQDDAPMLRFKNICSQLRLSLQGNGVTVKSITVESPDNNICLSGDFNIYPSTDGASAWEARTTSTTLVSGMHPSTTLDCGSGVDISTSKDFNIYLPVGTYNVGITIITAQGTRYTLNSNQPIQFYRNHVMRLAKTNIVIDAPNASNPPFANAGIFAVSSTEHVYIAPTNLMNTAGPNAYYDDSWAFSQHPYDMIGEYTDNQTVWNRFSWSTDNAGVKFGMKVDGHTDQTQNDGNFQDWGLNKIHSRDGHTIWPANSNFTLSADQWSYLLGLNGTTRLSEHMNSGMTSCYGFAYILPEAGYEIRIDANTSFTRETFLDSTNNTLIYELHENDQPTGTVRHRFPLGVYNCTRNIGGRQVAGIPVLVIYPDNFPADKQIDPLAYYANGITNKSYAISDEWYQELLDLGCAFLPLLGRGLGSGTSTSSSEVLFRGYYWTSTSQSTNQTNHIVLQNNGTDIHASVGSDTRSNGYAVRLAMPAPADTPNTSARSKKR